MDKDSVRESVVPETIKDIKRKRHLWQKLVSSHSRIFGIIAIIIVLVAIPLTVIVSQQQQQTKQEAASSCSSGTYNWCDSSCNTKSPKGACKWTYQECNGTWQSNRCPGPSNYKCCISSPKDNTATTTSTPSANYIQGDIDKDNKVTMFDYTILMSCSIYSQDNKTLCGKSEDYLVRSDLNNDGVINQIDYNSFLRKYASQSASVYPVVTPTPSPTPTLTPLPTPTNTTTVPTTGIMQLDNLVRHPSYKQYYHLPASTNGAYRTGWRTCYGMLWGSKELVEAIVTIANKWKQKYPNGYLVVWDMTSKNHISHLHGNAVDINASTNGRDCVANRVQGPTTGRQWQTISSTTNCKKVFNRQATVELGKMIVDTNVAIQILFADGSIMRELDNYSIKNGLSRSYGFDAKLDGDHSSHFHIRMGKQPKPDFEARCT